MRGFVSTMNALTVPTSVHPEKERSLVIVGQGDVRSSSTRFFSQREYEYLFALQGNENFLTSRAKENGRFLRDDREASLQKIFRAREVLRDLKDWYEGIFRRRDVLDDKDHAEKALFFNSNLIHFIAATDDNEDTIGHSQFVASYTVLLTKELGIEDRSFLVDIERGALLHDIGKIGIPDSILRKRGPLTAIEREIIKDHPLLGYKLIEEFSFLQRPAQVVLCHHEHFNGKGYPYGLVGEDIPLEARIFSLADTVDAITSDRPYRKGRSFDEARREIERYSSSQFDPQLVEVFLSIPEERWQRAKLGTLRTLRPPTLH
jgi:putative nucleotidyltransferase with HDIG domain